MSCHAPPDVVNRRVLLHLHHRADGEGLADGGREALRGELPDDLIGSSRARMVLGWVELG